MCPPLEFPRSRGFDRDYWLSRCEGFRVETAEGRPVGAVVELRYRSAVERPDRLVVRGGRFATRVVIVPVASVAAIVPGEERLVLRPQAAEQPQRAEQRRLGAGVWSRRRPRSPR
jgi:hypothetical protein